MFSVPITIVLLAIFIFLRKKVKLLNKKIGEISKDEDK